ncbi:MAG: methylmalonyl-CoA epimerase [Chloroflexi bacterium]|nr:methylmalonyl-CoA epimerase [Chloroflexota bacterium]
MDNSNTSLNHLAIAVTDLDAAIAFYRDVLGLPLDRVEDVQEEKSKVAFLPLGNSEIELVQPTSESTGVAKWLAKHGPGMHHVAIQVENLDAVIARLTAAGIELTNPEPRQKADGTRYTFIHPRSAFGVLIELYQKEIRD